MFECLQQVLFRKGENSTTNTSHGNAGVRATISAPFIAHVIQTGPAPLDVIYEDDPTVPIHKQRCAGKPELQFMSDLHLERRIANGKYVANIPQAAPYLVLAGDIGRFCDEAFGWLLRDQCRNFKQVLLIPGNHEFYGSSRDDGLKSAEALESNLGGAFVLMHRRRLDLEDGTIILGCTLHSPIPRDSALTNEFSRIHNWRVTDHNNEYFWDRT